MVHAIWNGAILADSDDVVVVDGYTYFPRASVDPAVLVESEHSSVCPWKGRANYYSVSVNGSINRDAAWYYPDPKRAARGVTDRIAFWRGVKVVNDAASVGPRRGGLIDWFRRSFRTSGSALADGPSTPATTEIVELDDSTFAAAIKGGWTIVDFWASWCAPCLAFHPRFEQAALEHDGPARFARCNVEAAPEASAVLEILSIPTVILFDPDGQEVKRVVGVPTPRDLSRLIQHVGAPERAEGS